MGLNSMVAVWDGPRGSGKTLSMTVDAIVHMIRGIDVWSNYRISIYTDWGTPGEFELYESKPLDMKAIFSLDSSIANGWVYVDEIYLWCDNRRSQSVANRMLNGLMALIRHRRLSFGFTTQQFEWLDKRLQFQCDTLVECTDLHFKYHQLPQGALIGQTYKDLSGMSTGTPYFKNGKTVIKQLYAKPFWNCYDSWQEFDFMEAQKKIKIDVSNNDGGENEGAILEVLSFLKESKVEKISSSELLSMLQSSGFEGTLRQAHGLKSQGLVYHRGGKENYYTLGGK